MGLLTIIERVSQQSGQGGKADSHYRDCQQRSHSSIGSEIRKQVSREQQS
jgi:hypothetical protein